MSNVVEEELRRLITLLRAAVCCIHCTVGPLMSSARASGFMLKPVLNISGSTTT